MSTDGISLSLNTTSSRHEVNMDDLRALVVSQNTKQPTDAEMYVFKRLCESLGANPFLRDIHIVKYSETSPASFITGKDFFTKVARSQNATWESGILVVRQGESQETKLIGTFMLPTDSLVGGWADVHTKDGTMPTTVLLSDFDTGKSLWAKMPGTMIRKVALVGALREAFPERFAGAYSAEEMDQAPQFEDIDLVKSIETIDDSYSPTPADEYPYTNKYGDEVHGFCDEHQKEWKRTQKQIEKNVKIPNHFWEGEFCDMPQETLSAAPVPQEMTRAELEKKCKAQKWNKKDLEEALGSTLDEFLNDNGTPFTAWQNICSYKQRPELM